MTGASSFLLLDAVVWIIAGAVWFLYPDVANQRLNDADIMDTPLEDMTRGFGASLVFGGATQLVLAPFVPVLVATCRLTFVLALLVDLTLRHGYAVLATPRVYGLLVALVLPCVALVRRSVGAK